MIVFLKNILKIYLYTQKKLDCGNVILSASFKTFSSIQTNKNSQFLKTRAEPKEKDCHSRHLIYSLYISLKQWCPALTLEEHFPVDLSTNTWSAASLESVIIWFRCLFLFFCCCVKSTSIYIIDLHANKAISFY